MDSSMRARVLLGLEKSRNTPKKPLYIAKSFQQINQIAVDEMVQLKSQPMMGFASQVGSMYQHAIYRQRTGDEELSFLLYAKTLFMLQRLTAQPEYMLGFPAEQHHQLTEGSSEQLHICLLSLSYRYTEQYPPPPGQLEQRQRAAELEERIAEIRRKEIKIFEELGRIAGMQMGFRQDLTELGKELFELMQQQRAEQQAAGAFLYDTDTSDDFLSGSDVSMDQDDNACGF